MTSIITYEQIKDYYNKFKNNLPQDEFIRYYREYHFLKSLIEMSQKQNLKKDFKEYQEVQKNVIKHLNDMGYKLV